jgi:hypothetical protein
MLLTGRYTDKAGTEQDPSRVALLAETKAKSVFPKTFTSSPVRLADQGPWAIAVTSS